MSIPTSTTKLPLTATVLCVKQYPAEEIVVLLDGSPAVVTFRNVKQYQPGTSDARLKNDKLVSIFEKNIDIGGILEGARLLVVELGRWNVNTAALDNCRVTMLGEECDSTNRTSIVSKVPSTVPLPKRRKRMSMQ